MMITFPVKVKMRREAMDELHSCEYGSYEDHIHADDSREEPYADGTLHIVELLERSPFKTVVYLENQEEVDEFFGQACTGTFGLYFRGTCLRIYDQLLPLVSEQAAKMVSRSSIGF